jgi:hypothetical protein
LWNRILLTASAGARDGDILAAIERDFPAWQPADGLCTRCAELYASHVAM